MKINGYSRNVIESMMSKSGEALVEQSFLTRVGIPISMLLPFLQPPCLILRDDDAHLLERCHDLFNVQLACKYYMTMK